MQATPQAFADELEHTASRATLRLVHAAAEMAEAAYLKTDAGLRITLPAAWETCRMLSPGRGAQAFVAHGALDNGEPLVLISIRGTQSPGFGAAIDWIQNLMGVFHIEIGQNPSISVARGAWRQANAIRKALKLRDRGGFWPRKIVVVGHSLGGQDAHVLGYLLSGPGRSVKAISLEGSRPGDEAFAASIETNPDIQALTVVHKLDGVVDAVPLLPPGNSPGSPALVLDADRQEARIVDWEEIEAGTSTSWWTRIGLALRRLGKVLPAHSIANVRETAASILAGSRG